MAAMRVLTVVAAFGFLGGCTTLLYKGPTRSASEVAVITSIDTIVDKVDNVMVRDSMGTFAHLEVLPGPHRLGISLNQVEFGGVMRSGGYIIICAELEAGHTYQTRPMIRGDRFAPVLVDMRTNKAVDPRCRRGGAKPQAVLAAPSPHARPKIDPAPTEPLLDVPSSGEVVAAAASESSPPPPPPAPATDSEEPLMDAAELYGESPQHLPSDAVLANRPPGSGISLFFGGGFGGEDFVKATSSNGDEETLSSGTGFILGVGVMLTPLWIAETVGFGVAADAGIKYDHLGADNGEASITRYPISLSAQMLANFSNGGNHYLIVKGGVIRDFGVNYSISGFDMIDANVSGTWGPIGAIGYYKRSTDFYGWDILGYFALNNHLIGGQSISAHSIGVLCGMHFRPF